MAANCRLTRLWASLLVLIFISASTKGDGSTAVCTMTGYGYDPLVSVYGLIIFTQTSPNDAVVININLFGFNATDDQFLHGLQIHASGNVSKHCQFIGPIFNPFDKLHGPPFSFDRKVGDLGNVGENFYGQVQVTLIDRMISLAPYASNSILGKSLAVHQYLDDYGQGNGRNSIINGNVGQPLACCQIMGSMVPQPPIPPFPPRGGPQFPFPPPSPPESSDSPNYPTNSPTTASSSSNGWPGQSKGWPGQSNGWPGQSNGWPGQSNGGPSQSNGGPGQFNNGWPNPAGQGHV